ncbi:MAG TPA: cytochrome c [Anaerolineaceae bacterium]
MKRSLFLVIVVILLASLALAACGGGASSGSKARPNPPADYANKTNPLAGKADAAEAGKKIYTTNCTSCHGEKGLGDGPAGAALNPHPGNLQDTAKNASDGYMYWLIAEGGAPAGKSSSMPAWKAILKEEQIWQVVTYIKTLK